MIWFHRKKSDTFLFCPPVSGIYLHVVVVFVIVVLNYLVVFFLNIARGHGGSIAYRPCTRKLGDRSTTPGSTTLPDKDIASPCASVVVGLWARGTMSCQYYHIGNKSFSNSFLRPLTPHPLARVPKTHALFRH